MQYGDKVTRTRLDTQMVHTALNYTALNLYYTTLDHTALDWALFLTHFMKLRCVGDAQ